MSKIISFPYPAMPTPTKKRPRKAPIVILGSQPGGIQYDVIKKAKHYNSHPSGVECIDVARHHNFNIGNLLKYCWRAGLKDGDNTELQDLKKARYYLDDEIKQLEKAANA